MKLRYTIEDLDCCDYIVDFEFHKELDGQIVFDSAWTILNIVDGWLNNINITSIHDDAVKKWLSENEYKIYNEAERQFADKWLENMSKYPNRRKNK